MGGGAERKQTAERQITLDEVSGHRTPKDAWTYMKGKVYDVSGWNTHPGTFHFFFVDS